MQTKSIRIAEYLLKEASFQTGAAMRKYYPWAIGFARQYLGEPSAEDQLTAYAMRAVTQAHEMAGGFNAGNRREFADILATASGAYAARLGMTPDQVTKWLQSAYGSVWVKGGNLDPGLDLKQVRRIIDNAYDLAVRRRENPGSDLLAEQDEDEAAEDAAQAAAEAAAEAAEAAEAEAEADEHGENAARFTDAAAVIRGMFAGNATITLVSNKTGKRFTYKVSVPQKDKGKKQKDLWFVSVLTGPLNTSDFTYIGVVRNKGGYQFALTQKSAYGMNAPSVKTFAWFIGKIQELGSIPPEVQVWHEGRCLRCGRKLTVPSSIEDGIGPECASKMEGE